MPVSLVSNVDVICGTCGTARGVPTWLVLDLHERPDLRHYLSSGEWTSTTCDVCGERSERSAPLLVIRLSPSAPLILAFPRKAFDDPDPVSPHTAMIDAARERLGDAARDVPGPLLAVPYEVVVVASARDLEADVGDPDIAKRELDLRAPEVRNYGLFLSDVRDSTPARRLQRAMGGILDLRQRDDLRELIHEYPEITTDDALQHIDEWGQGGPPELAALAAAQIEMLRTVRTGDVTSAWLGYEQAIAAYSERFVAPEVQELQLRLDECEASGDFTGAIEAGEALLEMAQIPGAPAAFEANVSARVAAALLAPRGDGRADRIERAISLLQRTAELADADAEASEAINRASVVTNLGYAFSDRLYGDPVANQERAIERYRQVLELVTIDSDGDSWAIAHTNLGLSLLERAQLNRTSEFDWRGVVDVASEEQDITLAIDHFEQALRWRSFERDPRDWAFTEVNLGLAYSRRRNGADDIPRALAHYQAAERGYAAAGDRLNHAQVLHNIAGVKTDLARLIEGDERAQRVLLEEAVDACRESLIERPVSEAPVDAGRTHIQLGHYLLALGDKNGAAAAYRESLRALRADVAPRFARDAARALAQIEQERNAWDEAAQTWEAAAQAAAAAWGMRSTASGRLQELRENVNVFRWAAYALTKAGRAERAVEILELGRARELALWLEADHKELRQLRAYDPELASRYQSVRAELRRLEFEHRAGGDVPVQQAATLAEELASLTAAIRTLPGFATLQTSPELPRIAATLEADDALVYLLTSPAGAIALVVTAGPGGVSVTAIDAPEVRSQDIYPLFVSADPENETVGGYFAAHRASDEELTRALLRFSQALGAPLLGQVAAAATAAGASRLCLVPISLLGLLPLAALTWEENGPRCLLDTFEVVHTPSAVVLAACRHRAERYQTRRALIIGNPLPQESPLPGAEFEARLVAQSLAKIETQLLLREEATKARVLEAIPHAQLVHFACHGAASILNRPLNAALFLANDEPLYAEEILELDNFVARLVVASACETGVVQGYEAADEALTLGNTFLAAGAAAVVSSLWSVDDVATSLLMSRFYETLDSEYTLAGALRHAQLWLRDATAAGLQHYIATRPMLRERLGALRRGDAGTGPTPFSSITKWGAFIFAGA
jgi:CHAT domain-containing protein